MVEGVPERVYDTLFWGWWSNKLGTLVAFCWSILVTRLAVVTLSSLWIEVYLYYLSRSRIIEAFARRLPISLSAVDMSVIAPSFEEDAPGDQDAIDNQVYHQGSCYM